MEQVKTFDEISKAIKEHFKVGVITNCFITEEEYKKEIQNKTLYIINKTNYLIILREREEHYKLNYYINQKEKIEIKTEKPIVVEIIKRPNDKKFEEIVKTFTDSDFTKILERERYTLENVENVENKYSHKTEMCKKEESEEIIKTLKNNFDKHTGCIPTEEELKKEIEKQNIYCIKKQNEIAGILHKKENKAYTEIKHLAVNEKYRKQGIADELIKKLKEQSRKITVWTGKENKAAQKTYEKTGFKKDGWTSIVLISHYDRQKH